MSKAKIDDVAKLAGFSIKTVSRVINNEPNVREATRAKVEEAIAELNYRPNLSARNLASHHSHLIALIYDDPSAYEIPSAGYIIRMQQGALRACGALGYELLIHPCLYRGEQASDDLKALVEQARPDGIVLAAPLSNMPNIVRTLKATGTPLVMLSPGKKNGTHLSIATNDREISAKMTCYLASLGHQKIAFIKGDPDHKAVGNRYLGYLDGLDQSALKFDERFVAQGDNSIGSGEIGAELLLGQGDRPTAIFAANDDMAAGVIRVADRLGITVPQELSVAGCDDIALARQIYPALTTIRQPLSAMAERATSALIDHLRAGTPLSGTEVVSCSIQVRESSGPTRD